MPCRCDGYAAPENTEWRHNSDVAEAFCELCSWMVDNGYGSYMTPKASKWWNEHKEIDREKREIEIERAKFIDDKKNALSKLTDYERKLLGIK